MRRPTLQESREAMAMFDGGASRGEVADFLGGNDRLARLLLAPIDPYPELDSHDNHTARLRDRLAARFDRIRWSCHFPDPRKIYGAFEDQTITFLWYGGWIAALADQHWRGAVLRVETADLIPFVAHHTVCGWWSGAGKDLIRDGGRTQNAIAEEVSRFPICMESWKP